MISLGSSEYQSSKRYVVIESFRSYISDIVSLQTHNNFCDEKVFVNEEKKRLFLCSLMSSAKF